MALVAVLDVKQTLGSKYLITDFKSSYRYENGRKTFTEIGTKIEIVLFEKGFTKVWIKTKLPKKDIESRLNGKLNLKVSFKNLTSSLWIDKSNSKFPEIKISWKATDFIIEGE